LRTWGKRTGENDSRPTVIYVTREVLTTEQKRSGGCLIMANALSGAGNAACKLGLGPPSVLRDRGKMPGILRALAQIAMKVDGARLEVVGPVASLLGARGFVRGFGDGEGTA
jgi:hypothetical protein